MHRPVHSLAVANFRCHTAYTIDFTEPTTIITGSNGSGKTSLIEAVHILMRGRSFKSSDSTVLRHNSPAYRIEITCGDARIRAAHYDQKSDKKSFIISGKKSTRLPANARYPIVLFEPTHLGVIHGSPSRRRNFLDQFISQIDPTYSTSLARYEKALRQRNALLKSELATPESVFPWNILLSKHGSEIITKRTKFTRLIDEKLTPTYASIADRPDQIKIDYENPLTTESALLARLENSLKKDQITKHTSIGPHRDDIHFSFNNSPAADTSSRGEIRSIILALKFIESELIQSELEKSPLILLDDIFSELDQSHQHHLATNFKQHQIIITSVAPPPTPPPRSQTIRL